MPRAADAPYNGGMSTTDTTTNPTNLSTDTAPRFAVAGTFLEALAAQDFAQLASTLEPEASLRALLPRGFCEWNGATDISEAFARWFGDVERFEVVDASVGQVGDRLQLRWRVGIRGPRLGDDDLVVEQHVYADIGATGRIGALSLLCSGYRREHVDA
jgi:hypothetical protein